MATFDTNNLNRTRLAKWIVVSGFIVIALLAITIICLAREKSYEASQWVFNGVVPMIASWVGTVIAFYFGRENYEAATKQALALTRDTLDDLKVKNIMINVRTIVAKRIDEEKYATANLKELITLYEDVDKDRIPIFSAVDTPKYIIHRSTMNEYIKNNKDEEDKLTLKNFIEDKDNANKYSHNKKFGFITVTKETSIQDAREQMNNLDGCKDIFITENGGPTGKVLGWLTDTLVNRFLDIKEK
ncbi:hypothetical protein [Aquimarina aggregata]|uniref:hypothetical protein n=1 Tax=Aquimarina aggregata TaxID=1642818 RepID=UPI0024917A54|nr:hypothetical protein [Aquimarina aggregata]